MSAKRVVLGVSGGIAAFKAAAIASRLVQANHHVSVVMSESALRFIGPATFTALCGQAPVLDAFDSRYPLGPHIELASNCDLLLIAPATARLLASCSLGLADDLLATLYLNVECPVVFAPAMSTPMWEKAAVQRHISQLRSDGCHFVGPASGWLSCRRQGLGRMEEPDAILSACREWLI
ncbi:MAG: phosphopantothenoylcysteine decarboxylase [Pirellula sp.]|jgi:phosphopantothenoylcysteine decarboxylase/phosphopantothenate--cysteine ligase|nr:phosphopantothenoylcysteine decarboxylase [Pirellula sp.]